MEKTIWLGLALLLLLPLAWAAKTITVTEGDLVKLSPQAKDADNDAVKFSYSAPLNDFTGEWQTDLEDAGTYVININASDGKSFSNKEVVLVVKNKNRPPKIEAPMKIEVKEGDKIESPAKISDPDNDELKVSYSKFFNGDFTAYSFASAGEYNVTVTADDGEFKEEKQFTIVIKDTNLVPEIKEIKPAEKEEIKEDVLYQFAVKAEDADGDKMSYLWKLNGVEASRESSFSRYFSFNDSGIYAIEVAVSDGRGGVTAKKSELTVKNVNRAPKLPIFGEIKIKEGEEVKLNLSEKDEDGQLIMYTIDAPLDNKGYWKADFKSAGEYEIAVLASDGEKEVRGMAKITAEDVDLPPVIETIGALTVKEGERLVKEIKADDPDGDKVKIEIKDLPSGAELENNVLRWAPGFELVQRKNNFFTNFLSRIKLERVMILQTKNVNLRITACGKEKCANQSIPITVENTNRAPVIEDLTNLKVKENEAVTVLPKGTDLDGNRIKWRFSAPLDAQGRWKTDYASAGNYTATITASDGYLSSEKNVQIAVEEVNRPSTLKIDGEMFRLREGDGVEFNVQAIDPDAKENVTKVFIENLPKGASFSQGLFAWIPGYDAASSKDKTKIKLFDLLPKEKIGKEYKVTFIAKDGELETKHPISIIVYDINQQPEIEKIVKDKKGDIKVGGAVIFEAFASDKDNEALEYNWNFDGHKVAGKEKIKYAFKTPGIKIITVAVNDGRAVTEKTVQVKVAAEKKAAVKTIAPPAKKTSK